MSLDHYLFWLRDRALPRWLHHAAAPDGLFHETLTLDGSPGPGPLRLRTGMRQAYVFAHAAQLGLVDRQSGVALAMRIVEALRAAAWAPDGTPGWVARFERDGTILDGSRDLYDHAFALLALGHLAQATGDPRYAAWIDETVAVIEAMHAPHGGWFQNDRQELPRSQNPHMHLFEASLALYETTRGLNHLARAGEIFGLLRGRFIDSGTGHLTEFFGPAWERGAEFRSERLDPGHMMEWTWLLRRLERATGHPMARLCDKFFGDAVRLGRISPGFLVDEVDEAGTPLVDRRRLWPQTEYLKALIVQSEAAAGTERQTLLNEANALAGRLLVSYLSDSVEGLWCDQYALDGRPSATTVPASTLYHLLAPAAEILRIDPSALRRSAATTPP